MKLSWASPFKLGVVFVQSMRAQSGLEVESFSQVCASQSELFRRLAWRRVMWVGPRRVHRHQASEKLVVWPGILRARRRVQMYKIKGSEVNIAPNISDYLGPPQRQPHNTAHNFESRLHETY